MAKINVFTPSEAAKEKGMSKQTFYYHTNIKKDVPGEIVIGHKRFFDKAAIRAWKPKDGRKGKR